MKKRFIKILKILGILYLALCSLLYFFQEKLIFFPEKLNKNYRYEFEQPFEELNFKTPDNILLNAVLFKAANPKGVIFYLHGNGGSVRSWGQISRFYTDLNYDVLMLDYRGYGKSEGTINSEKQLFDDMQFIYGSIKKYYNEDKIIVLGYSIGTGLAAKLASANHPKLLILQAPYYSLIDMMEQRVPLIPTFILKYKFETNKFLKACKGPVVIFHGTQDNTIYYKSSLKLKELFKPVDTLVTLIGQGHNNMTDNRQYLASILYFLGK